MTATRKKSTSTEVETAVPAASITLSTETVEVVTDPSVLYPPIPASKSVYFGHFSSIVPRTEKPKWKRYLVYAPPVIGFLIIIVTIVTIASL